MNSPKPSKLNADTAEEYYRLAEKYDALDLEDINPSLHELSILTERYSGHELIAEGGMKRIYKVYDSYLKRHLALAMLREDAPDDLADPLIHEAWLTSQLDHPNIIAVHDVGILEENRPFFTMDLKKGVTLNSFYQSDTEFRKKIKDEDFLNEALQIFLKICEAISYAHSHNVVHLDLKPANIQIGRFGRVVVCDWGLSTVLGEEDNQQFDRLLFNPDLLGHQSLYGQIKGTLGYMAPEQLKEGGAVDPRTDIYGLGGILYKILTDSAPLTGEAEKIVKDTREGNIMPPHRLAPEKNIPEALSAVVMKALSVDPENRYQSVDELHSEISRYLQGYATKAENAGSLKELKLFYLRNQRFCLMVAAFTFIICTGAIWFYQQLIIKERIASQERDRAEKNLMLYQAGKTELDKASLENINSIIELSHRNFLHDKYERALAILDAAMEARPNSLELARAKGEQLFKMQRFNEAIPWLEKGANRNDIIHRLAIKYAPLKDDKNLLPAPSVTELIGKLKTTYPIAVAAVMYDQRRRFDLEERAEIIEAFLRLINPNWTGQFQYDPEQNVLKMSGKNLSLISFMRSVIGGLGLRELDISNTGISDLWIEDKLTVEKLDISNSNITESWPLKNMLHLQQLTISEGQLDENELKKLSPEVRIITRPTL